MKRIKLINRIFYCIFLLGFLLFMASGFIFSTVDEVTPADKRTSVIVKPEDQDNNEVQLLESSEYEVTDFKKVLDDGGYKRNSRDEENELKNAGYHAEKQGDDGEATMEELGSDDDDDFDLDGFDDDFDDYGDGNREE